MEASVIDVFVELCVFVTQPTNIIEADGCEDATHAEKHGKSNFAFGKTKFFYQFSALGCFNSIYICHTLYVTILYVTMFDFNYLLLH